MASSIKTIRNVVVVVAVCVWILPVGIMGPLSSYRFPVKPLARQTS
jgi:hypothetical protein